VFCSLDFRCRGCAFARTGDLRGSLGLNNQSVTPPSYSRQGCRGAFKAMVLVTTFIEEAAVALMETPCRGSAAGLPTAQGVNVQVVGWLVQHQHVGGR
jgi:hypothetical protein